MEGCVIMPQPKLSVALFFGGVSSEHEISQISAANWLRALGQPPCADKYKVLCVGITKAGRCLLYTGTPDAVETGAWEQDPKNLPCVLSPDRTDRGLLLRDGRHATRVPVDVAVPILHGKNGEDGTIQGLFELAGIPYVGCGVLGSTVCMDKAVANTLMDAAGVPHCRWTWADRAEAVYHPEALLRRVEERLGYPVFVKPANAGSSVGVSRAADRAALQKAIETALAEDDKIVFEEAITGQEVECAAIGNPEDPATVTATRPGEILAGDVFYTYDDKYKNGVSQTVIPAHLDEQKLDEVRAAAIHAYTALGCTGLARCDLFVEKGTGRVLCNELNTMPGFTAISMYPKLMEADGLPMPQLADTLIGLACAKRKGAY